MPYNAGLFANMSTAEYFADPAPLPSLTQSLVKTLLDRSPLHAWYAHPRLNPDFVRDEDTKYDIGNIAHRLILGRGRELVVLSDFDDWRKKDAQQARADAQAEGRLAVLGKHYATADRMVRAAQEALQRRDMPDIFREDHGDAELCAIWQEGKTWCRQLMDWLSADRLTFADYKTTLESAAPHALARKMVNDGWHIQAAMAERALAKLDAANIGRRRYLFVVQEAQLPYALSVVELSETALTMGRKQLDAGLKLWTRCLTTDYWPGYPLQTIVPEFPEWAEAQWLDREVNEFAPVLGNVLEAG